MSSSIASALIRSTFARINAEMNQLESWLLSLQSAPITSSPATDPIDMALISSQLRQMAELMEAQQLTLQRLSTRVEIIEENQQPTHEVHIAEEWNPAAAAIDPTEYQVIKEESQLNSLNAEVESIEAAWKMEEPKVEPKVQVEEPKMKVEEPKVKVEEPKVETKVQVEEPKVEEEEEEEEEDEGIEYEAVTFKGITYYKDPEGFIYAVDEDAQPSENAIGVWKEKTQSVAFYRKA